jgi:ATP-dependent DNA helicase RecG
MGNINQEQFRFLLNADSEHEHLEFKEAKKSFNFENGDKSLLGYCIALANEGGGKLILGVTDAISRQVVGTNAFENLQKTHEQIFTKLKRRVSIQELIIEGKRVLIFDIPPRPIAEPLEYRGQFLMRVGERLEPMTSEQLKNIYSESVTDYSACVSKEITMDSLDPHAIEELRKLLKVSGRTEKSVEAFSNEQLLRDLNLLQADGLTLASLV